MDYAEKQKGTIMCRKLNELSGLGTDDLLDRVNLKIPINIESLLSELGVHYDAMDFSYLEENNTKLIEENGHVLGAVTLIDDDVNIFYSDRLTREQRRFTMAHELAHCCLDAKSLENGHIEFQVDTESKLPKELMASAFARRLLIPKKELKKMYDSLMFPLSNVLAKEFDVELKVMEDRLKELKLPFYSPRIEA